MSSSTPTCSVLSAAFEGIWSSGHAVRSLVPKLCGKGRFRIREWAAGRRAAVLGDELRLGPARLGSLYYDAELGRQSFEEAAD